MDRYYTLMIVPEREKGVKSLRIPRFAFLGLSFLLGLIILFVSILIYNYVQVLYQISDNRHLNLENRQLKEQIQLFQMKLNTLGDDLERLRVFEHKLRTITGHGEEGVPHSNLLDSEDKLNKKPKQSMRSRDNINRTYSSYEKNIDSTNSFNNFQTYDGGQSINWSTMSDDPFFIELKRDYEKKIAFNFGLLTGYTYTKEWSNLTKQSFAMASLYASFDFKYSKLRNLIDGLELKIHQLDQDLLDKDSFLKSTPTIFPTTGWITSYFGPRKSPYSGQLKMHEGIDIGARVGTHIIAPADGVVTFAGNKPGLGNFVQIEHGYGLETVFGHAKKVLVGRGKYLKRGDKIAMVGNTGYSTGPHVHYEIRINGVAVDPLYYILNE